MADAGDATIGADGGAPNVAAGAGQGPGPILPGEFAITTATKRIDVTLGATADVVVHVTRDVSNHASVDLTVSGLPTGVTVADATAAAADASATLTFTAAKTAISGVLAPIEIDASDGTTTRSLKLQLLVRGLAGTLDKTFGTNGVATWSGVSGDFGDGHLIGLPDGHLLVGGSVDGPSSQELAVMRFDAEGKLDKTFGAGGVVRQAPGPLFAIGDAFGVREDGTIVVAGYTIAIDPATSAETFQGVQLQVTATGALDPGFGIGGMQRYDDVFGFEDFNFENGQAIAVGNRDFDSSDGIGIIGKLDAAGNLDQTFGTAGLRSWPTLAGGAWRVVRDGAKYVALATCSNKACIARFDASGTPDASWGTAGVLTPAIATAALADIKLNAKGQYVIVGSTGDDWLLARITSTGQVLSVADSFTTGDDNATGLLIDADDHYYVLGTQKQPLATPNVYAPLLVRYDADFQRDPTFGTAGRFDMNVETTFVGNVGVVQQPDGRIVVGTTVRGAGTLQLYRVWN